MLVLILIITFGLAAGAAAGIVNFVSNGVGDSVSGMRRSKGGDLAMILVCLALLIYFWNAAGRGPANISKVRRNVVLTPVAVQAPASQVVPPAKKLASADQLIADARNDWDRRDYKGSLDHASEALRIRTEVL